MKTINTLFGLLEKYYVKIPIIQRDYVQGNADSVRDILLEDMKNAIIQNKQLDLNFVYGKTITAEQGSEFYPVDGQQRLTTLFLLYLYAFAQDDTKTELFERFSYETRISSKDYLKMLTKHRNKIFKGKIAPSKFIEDAEWFSDAWINDPTVQSSMAMLDAIKLKFNGISDLAEKLVKTDNAPITFNFLKIDELGNEDGLYIKLNARGRALTPFENFKAKFIDRLKDLNHPLCAEIERNLDGKWTDLFWGWVNRDSQHSKISQAFDGAYLSFFSVLFCNMGLFGFKSIAETGFGNTNAIINKFDFIKIDKKIVDFAYSLLNYLCDKPDAKVKEIVFNAIANSSVYNKILFHAVAVFVSNVKDGNFIGLKHWLRIFANLTDNSRIDDATAYQKALKLIDESVNNKDDILTYFANNTFKDKGFNPGQLDEESLKCRIILSVNGAEERIIKAESNKYFSGQIRSALYYSNLERDKDLKLFDLYWKKITSLFTASGAKYSFKLHRALLSFGDYTLSVGSRYKTLCVDDPKENLRTPSFKSLFSKTDDKRITDILRAFLNRLDVGRDIEEQLDEIIQSNNVAVHDWKYCLISYPELFNCMNRSHLRICDGANGGILLVPNKASSGFNYNIYLSTLKMLLGQNGISSELGDGAGAWMQYTLLVNNLIIQFRNGKFEIFDETRKIVFQSGASDLYNEVIAFLKKYMQEPLNV